MAESHAVPEPVDAVDRAYDDGWRDGAWRIAAAVIDPEAAWRCQRAAYRLHRLRARREGVRDA